VSHGNFYGTPNIKAMSDDQVLKLGNKNLEIVRADFKALKENSNLLKNFEVNLRCTTAEDCEQVPVGHKICGGPISFILIYLLT